MIPGAFGAEEPGEVGEGAQVPEGSLEGVGSERFSTHHTGVFWFTIPLSQLLPPIKK